MYATIRIKQIKLIFGSGSSLQNICITKTFILYDNFHIKQELSIALVRIENYEELDESTACRYLKSPRSLSGSSLNLTLVTKLSRSWSWITDSNLLCSMSIGPLILRYSYPWSKPCVCSKVKVTFDLENSKVKVMVKVNPIGHIWGLEFNLYVCFSFRGNRTTFGWDIANSIFDLENSKSRSWPRSNLMVTFEA